MATVHADICQEDRRNLQKYHSHSGKTCWYEKTRDKLEHYELLRLTLGSNRNAGLHGGGSRRTGEHYGMPEFSSQSYVRQEFPEVSCSHIHMCCKATNIPAYKSGLKYFTVQENSDLVKRRDKK